MLKRKSLAEQVADRIRVHIKAGDYAVGMKLPTEPELMKTFGVGRSTIREAIKLLVNSAFLDVRQGVGTFVTCVVGRESLFDKFERANLLDVVEVRHLLEMRIAEKAVLNRKNEHIDKMEVALVERYKYAKEGDVVASIRADVNFHQAIADGCGNNILAELYRASSVYVVESFMQQFTDTSSFLETQELHEMLCQAIKHQDSKKTLSVLKQIITVV